MCLLCKWQGWWTLAVLSLTSSVETTSEFRKRYLKVTPPCCYFYSEALLEQIHTCSFTFLLSEARMIEWLRQRLRPNKGSMCGVARCPLREHHTVPARGWAVCRSAHSPGFPVSEDTVQICLVWISKSYCFTVRLVSKLFKMVCPRLGWSQGSPLTQIVRDCVKGTEIEWKWMRRALRNSITTFYKQHQSQCYVRKTINTNITFT